MAGPPPARPLAFPRLDGTERTEAIEEPGPSWHDYFYFSFAKAWGLLGFAVVDAWVIAAWLQPLQVVPLVLSLIAASYLELLLFRFLWYRPGPDDSASTGAFRPTWLRPVRFGRWTPEGERVRKGLPGEDLDERTGPDPSEFL